jgi:aminoglycoside 3-N-acetyltransferase I
MDSITIRRLGIEDSLIARRLFLAMAEGFEEEGEPLSDAYLHALLVRADFWALAAMVGEEVIGGLTAFTLPLTRREQQELFLYDLAVLPAWQRKGVGRALVEGLRKAGAAAGLSVVFVIADSADTHALDFYRALGGEELPATVFEF